ncbi:MAG: hypothetical protein SFU53_14630 [Terrimicrobiaceae bacterium]|nr:hypothetical protein [Terrimicrobiaceae bacterium]
MNLPTLPLVARHISEMGVPRMVPTMDYPDGPLLGNGDVTCVIGGVSGRQAWYVGKTDYWTDGVGWQTNEAYTNIVVAPIVIGRMELVCRELEGGEVRHHLNPATAELVSIWRNGETVLEIGSWVAATSNRIWITVENKSSRRFTIEWRLTVESVVEPPAVLPTATGMELGAGWVRRDTWDRGRWVCRGALAATGTDWTAPGPGVVVRKIEIGPAGAERILCAVAGGRNVDAPECAALSLLGQGRDTDENDHLAWWSNFWNQSAIDLGGGILERFWYGSLYVLACCNRSGCTAPGIFAFPTQDHPRWNGDYHLNYNFEFPYQAVYSANHMELADPYYRAILDFLPEALRRGREDLDPPRGGALYPVGIGADGVVVHDDYMSQKSCAVFAATNFINHHEYARDPEFLRERGWPFLCEVATFWENFLVEECGRWVIRGSSAHEHGDSSCNSTYDLSLVRRLFRFLIESARDLPVDEARIERWRDIERRLSRFARTEFRGTSVIKESEDIPEFRRSISILNAFWPGCGDFTIGSPEQQLAWDTIRLLELWDQGNSFPWVYPAAVRVGYPDIVTRMESHLADTHVRYWVMEGDPRNPDRYFPAGWTRGLRENFTLWHCLGGLETAGAAVAVTEMLLQSHEGFLRLFPVWPAERDASFRRLRAKGAFLVSARLRAGVVDFVEVESERGGTLRILSPWSQEIQTFQMTVGEVLRLTG